MPRKTSFPIDPEKLRKEIEKRNMPLREVSYEVGASADYMSGVLKTGRISPQVAELMKLKFNLPYEDYKPEQTAPRALETPERVNGQMQFQPQITIDYKQLYMIIYAAAKNALKDANKEDEEAKDGTED